MRSRQLEIAVTVFLEEAGLALQELLERGAEVPIELVARSSRRGQTPLYTYRPLTRRFIREHAHMLRGVHAYAQAVGQLAEFAELERYLLSYDLSQAPADADGQARVALGLLVEEVFAEQTDFKLRPQRLRAALERIEGTSAVNPRRVMLVATLHGLALASPELALAPGLSITRPDSQGGLPEELVRPEGLAGDHLLVIHAREHPESGRALAAARQQLAELLRALRLYGDGRVTLGALAWTRIGAGPWRPIALGLGGRPRGRLLVMPDQEDELRAFCNLVSQRTPAAGRIAWALGRFEMGCERPSEAQALNDYMLGLGVLLARPELGEPERAADGLLAPRLAAVCAAPQDQAEVSQRILAALALERSIIEQGPHMDARAEALVRELGEHLRALLRDVICGHLDADLAVLADEILSAASEGEPAPVARRTAAADGAGHTSAPPPAAAADRAGRASADAPKATTRAARARVAREDTTEERRATGAAAGVRGDSRETAAGASTGAP